MNIVGNRLFRLSFQFFALSILFLLLSFFSLEQINLVTADIGRHIKNGEAFVEQGKVISTNFYSYTKEDRPVVNHHWGAGVVFYLIWKSFDFKGLALFYSLLFLATFFIFFRLAERLSSFSFAYFFSVLSLPLVVSRLEVRPEGFSYFFLGLFLYLLYRYKATKSNFFHLYALVILQIFWVNLHIFYVMGPFLVFVFLMDAFFNEHNGALTKQYSYLLILMILVCFINPAGWRGVLQPFSILHDYGYMLAENQSVIFMQRRFPGNWLYVQFEIIFSVMVLGFILVFWKNRQKRQLLIPVFLMVFYSVLGWKPVRGLAMYGFVSIPMVSFIYHYWIKRFGDKKRGAVSSMLIAFSIILVVLGLADKNRIYSPYRSLNLHIVLKDAHRSKWVFFDVLKNFRKIPGLVPYVNGSAKFFKRNQIKGPIFNNYDLGGYLIFHLFPEHRVFIDNRPESYGAEFFKEVYIPMQEKEGVWTKFLERYRFNAIYFYRLDQTPWAQPFLIKRIEDPDWIPVFVDPFSIILVRKRKDNAQLIRRYQLPKSMFQVISNR